MKKLLSIVFTVLIVMTMTSVYVAADSANGITLRVETRNAQVGINYEDALIVTVYGTWNNNDAVDLFMEYDTECLEFVSAYTHANAVFSSCFLAEDGKLQYSAAFNSDSSNDECKMFECSFKSKQSGDTQLVFSANAPVVINGQNEFTVTTSGLDVNDKNEMFDYSVSDGKITLRGIFSAAIDEKGLLEIPAEIDGMPVSAIGSNFVTYNDYVKNAVVPSSVTDIGAYAFYNCPNLKDVYIFSDSAEIDSGAIGWVNGSVFDKGITIHGAKGSTAEKYAAEKGMFFHECSEYHKAEEFSLADVNGDGDITASDARLALRAAAKIETLTPAQFSAADIIRNSAVNAADARIILRIAAKLDSVDFYR